MFRLVRPPCLRATTNQTRNNMCVDENCCGVIQNFVLHPHFSQGTFYIDSDHPQITGIGASPLWVDQTMTLAVWLLIFYGNIFAFHRGDPVLLYLAAPVIFCCFDQGNLLVQFPFDNIRQVVTVITVIHCLLSCFHSFNKVMRKLPRSRKCFNFESIQNCERKSN